MVVSSGSAGWCQSEGWPRHRRYINSIYACMGYPIRSMVIATCNRSLCGLVDCAVPCFAICGGKSIVPGRISFL